MSEDTDLPVRPSAFDRYATQFDRPIDEMELDMRACNPSSEVQLSNVGFSR